MRLALIVDYVLLGPWIHNPVEPLAEVLTPSGGPWCDFRNFLMELCG